MSRIKNALARFFYGRYGVDSLYKFLFGVWLVLAVVNIFVQSYVLYVVELLVVFYTMYRCLSKNVAKRAAENRKYLAAKSKITGFFKLQRNKWRDRKTHVYRNCPSCRSTLRLPKIKGEHDTTCPRCKTRFHLKV